MKKKATNTKFYLPVNQCLVCFGAWIVIIDANQKKIIMKQKTILSVLFFSLIAVSTFGQEAQDMEKEKKIQENPDLYIKQGGVLPDKNVRVEKTIIRQPDFVIHKSSDDELRKVKYETLEELNRYNDQTSLEYQELKKDWIKQHQLEYEKSNPTVPVEKVQSIEERKKNNPLN